MSIGSKLAAGGAALVLLVVVMAAGAGVASLLGGGDTSPSATAVTQIPSDMLALYQGAASTCPGLPWTVLAAIGTVESGNGTSNLPGVHSGANSAGAEGPMQFEPVTFAAYATPVPPGGVNPPSPYDPDRRCLRRCSSAQLKGTRISIAPLPDSKPHRRCGDAIAGTRCPSSGVPDTP
jgi:hypothetical protein